MALTHINLIELLKAKSESTIIAHLNLLESFLPIRYESQNFFEKEVTLALFKKGFLTIEIGTDLSIKIFSKTIDNQEELSTIYNSTSIITKFGLFNLIDFQSTNTFLES